jgi:hypothetical protein
MMYYMSNQVHDIRSSRSVFFVLINTSEPPAFAVNSKYLGGEKVQFKIQIEVHNLNFQMIFF